MQCLLQCSVVNNGKVWLGFHSSFFSMLVLSAGCCSIFLHCIYVSHGRWQFTVHLSGGGVCGNFAAANSCHADMYLQCTVCTFTLMTRIIKGNYVFFSVYYADIFDGRKAFKLYNACFKTFRDFLTREKWHSIDCS